MHASSTFAPVNHVIYTLGGEYDTLLEALDPANGSLLWTGKAVPGSEPASIIGTSHSTIFLTALNAAGNSSLFALSLVDGHQLWSTDSPNRILAVVIGS